MSNSTPYAAGAAWHRDKEGAHEWIVAVKGTFDIREDGSVSLAEKQIEPLRLPVFYGETGVSSLRYDADVVETKPTTDVLINGTAYAPNGRPSSNFLVEMRVGHLQKTLRVLGDRTWGDGLFEDAPSPAKPLFEVPIVYERAYGGYDQVDADPANQAIDLRNPVGVGVCARKQHRAGRALPNLEYPSGRVEKNGPAGFGAIASYWSPRRELCGTYDQAWEQTRKPLLAEDWSPRALQSAPVDQQSAFYLSGGEAVELVNLTRSGVLRFQLPMTQFSFTTHISGRRVQHGGSLSTVLIEPDFQRVIMVWTTTLLCRTDGDYLDETVIREEKV